MVLLRRRVDNGVWGHAKESLYQLGTANTRYAEFGENMRRESSYEKAFSRIVKQLFEAYRLPYKYVKTTTPGSKGWPDRLLLFGPQGHHLYIEWKQPGKEPDAMQEFIHAELRALGAEVRWYDNHYIALVEVEAFVRAKTGTSAWDDDDCPEWWRQIILKARKGEDEHSPEKLRSPKAIRARRLPTGPGTSARRDDLVALRVEQVGGLPALKDSAYSWGEDGTLESYEDGRGCILDEYRGLIDE